MFGSGRWLVVAMLATTMPLFTSGIAEAAWPATADGPVRAAAVVMPVGQAPTATRTLVILSTTNTVVIPRPLLLGSTRLSTFDVYRSTSGAAPAHRVLTGCTDQATTRTCSDTGLSWALFATYSYAVVPRVGTSWVGARSPASNSA